MLKTRTVNIFQYLKKRCRTVARRFAFGGFVAEGFAGVIVLLLALYYPLGGSLMEEIDKNTAYEAVVVSEDQSATVETMAF